MLSTLPFLLALLPFAFIAMASADPRDEKQRQREEERARHQAEQERKRAEHAQKTAEAKQQREAEMAARKNAQDAQRNAKQGDRNAEREAQQARLKAEQEARRAQATQQQAERRKEMEARKQALESRANPVLNASSGRSTPDTDLWPDQGILSDFQAQHIGEGFFSEHRIDHELPDEGLILQYYDLGSPLKVRLYLDKSLRNHRAAIDEPSRFEVGRNPQLLVRIWVDEIESGHFVEHISNTQQANTWTTWYYHLIPDVPRPWNVCANEYEYAFGEMIEHLEPGHHRLRMEWEMLPDHQDGMGLLLASAELELDFDLEQWQAWKATWGHQVLAPAQVGAQTGLSYMRVQVQNRGKVQTPYQVQQGSSTLNSSLSAGTTASHNLNPGDKILVRGQIVHVVSPQSDGQTIFIV